MTLCSYSPAVGTVLAIAPADATRQHPLGTRDGNVYLGTGMAYTVTATDVGPHLQR